MKIQPEQMLIEDMHFSNQIVGSRIKNVLARKGIVTLADLLHLDERELLQMPHFGTVSLAELTVKLKKLGVELKRKDTW